MVSRYFVTGGSGFIGRELVALILAGGDDARIFDIAPPGEGAHRDCWIEGDVRDRTALRDALAGYDPHYIFHLASDTDVSISDLRQFTTTLEGTANVIDLARELPSVRRFTHVSTQFVVRPGVQPLDEHHLEPYTVYGSAKAETERMMWAADLPMPWLIVRPTIVWGPHHPSFADHIFKQIRKRRYLHPRGATPIVRAFGFVSNVARQMLILGTLSAPATNKHVFYLGDGAIDYDLWADAFAVGLTGRCARRIPVSLLTLMGRLGDGLKRMSIRFPLDSGRAFRMSTSSRIDLDDTLTITGPPAVSFDEGVRETLAWLYDMSGNVTERGMSKMVQP